MNISYAAITLGVDGGIRSKSLIRNQSSSLYSKKRSESTLHVHKEPSIDSLYTLLQMKLKREPEKKDLYTICKMVKEHDRLCPDIPKETCGINEFINWFAKNFNSYKVLIHSFDLK